jgi:enoyl-CoA hydratase/carnithine racemase
METMDELIEGITHGQQEDKSLRCIVISSSGNVFSSGHNLKELTEESGSEFHKRVFQRCSDLMMEIIKSPVPVLAKVDGLAAAAGCQLVATCDIAICTERSSFSTPG